MGKKVKTAPPRTRITETFVFPCPFYNFRSSADVCFNRKAKRSGHCPKCRQVIRQGTDILLLVEQDAL